MTTPTVREVRITAAQRVALMAQVTCPACKGDMPAGRLTPALLPTTGGVCGGCASRERREARVEAPMYETDAWSRGITL